MMPDTSRTTARAPAPLPCLRGEWPTVSLWALFLVLLVVFVAVMFHGPAVGYFGQLLGLLEKNDILSFLGIGMGGVLVALQAVASYKRARAMEDTVTNSEHGKSQERLKNAIEHLGNDSDSVRLGGAYELFHLAKDSSDLRQSVLDVLCAHVRGTTRSQDYQQQHSSEPSEEVQSLLTLLFVEKHRVFEGLRANLQGSYLNGARLASARLAHACLQRVQMRNAHLWCAELQGADLWSACLQDAKLVGAHLPGATLTYAKLQGAFLRDAKLQGGHLPQTDFRNAHLVAAQLQGADLRRVCLQGADLSDAKLQGVRLDFAQLQGANLTGTAFHGVDSRSGSDPHEPVTQIRNRAGRRSDLSNVVFSGGVTDENVEALTSGLSDEWATQLRARLAPHVGEQPSSKPPDGVTTGAYAEAQAKNWIAEYERVVVAPHRGAGRKGGSR